MLPPVPEPFDVPVIDISPYVTGGSDSERDRVAREIDAACATVGFIQILGHGIPKPALDGLTGAVDDFFALPLEAKKAYRVDGANRGYSPPKSESLSLSLGVESATRMNDFFEAFNVGVEARSFPRTRTCPRTTTESTYGPTSTAFTASGGGLLRARPTGWHAR